MEKEDLKISILESAPTRNAYIVKIRVKVSEDILKVLNKDPAKKAKLEFEWMKDKYNDYVLNPEGCCEATLSLPLREPEFSDLVARVTDDSGKVYEAKQQVPPLDEIQTEFKDKISQKLVVPSRRRVRIMAGEYGIDHNIIVEKGGIIIIDPGVLLAFAPGVGIYSQGIVHAVGDKNGEIFFRSKNENLWNGIVLDGPQAAMSKFKFCGIQNGRGHSINIVQGFAEIASELEGTRRGGGLLIVNTGFEESVELTNVAVRDCEAEQGGGVSVFNGKITIKNSGFERNKAIRSGGALHAQCSEVDFAETVKFKNNEAGISGGAIASVNGSTFNGTAPTFVENKAAKGGRDLFSLRSNGGFGQWRGDKVLVK